MTHMFYAQENVMSLARGRGPRPKPAGAPARGYGQAAVPTRHATMASIARICLPLLT